MIPVIQELLDAEEQAKKVVTEAREEVQREQSALDQEEHQHLQKARADADQRHQTATAKARAEADERHAAAVRELTDSETTFKARRKDDMGRVVDLVVAELCRTELEVE